MDDRVMQFRVGVFFLASLIATAILLAQFGNLPTWIGKYPVQIKFENAGGIMKGTPVRKSGMLIGRVANLQLADNDQKVLVTLEIQSDKTIYKNEAPSVTRDLLGDTAIVFAPLEGSTAPHEPIGDLDQPIDGASSKRPAGLEGVLQETMKTVGETGKALKTASNRLEVAADRVNKILNDDTQKRIERIIENTAESMDVIRRGLGDAENQKKLAKAMNELPKTLEKMESTFTKTDKALTLFTESKVEGEKSPIESLVHTIKMTEKSLHDFSQPTENGGPPPVDQIAKAVANINEITALMRNIMSRIDRGEGSLGALLKDRQLYDRLNKAARNIEQVSRELRPIVEDAGVFMDKAARHPGGIIRDAVKPGPGIK